MTHLLHSHTEEEPTARAEAWSSVDADAELAAARRSFALTLRAAAARRQKELADGEAVAQWTAALESEIRAFRRHRRARVFRKLLGMAILMTMLYSAMRGHAVAFWIFFPMFGGSLADAHAASRRKAARALATAGDPRAVGVLAMACRSGDKVTSDVAAEGLVGLLPRLHASDAQHISPEGMDSLLALLDPRRPRALQMAIVQALQQVGDARAIPAVERILDPSPGVAGLAGLLDRTLTASAERETEDLRRAAEDCLRTLRERAENDRQRSTLLRPSQDPAPAAATLLRPAGAGRASSDGLLRPAGGDGPLPPA
jgi:hypothetical protein